MNSIEGPLSIIRSSNCTEGCITRCILTRGSASVNVCIVVYILMLNNNLYLIDSYAQMITTYESANTGNSGFFMPKIDYQNNIIIADIKLFPNQVQ